MPAISHQSVTIVAAVLLSILIPIGVMWLISIFTGWRKLARAFPAQPRQPDARSRLTSLSLRYIGGYNNCVLWNADDEYLHLRLMPPFAWMSHPPVSIPWAAIEIVKFIPKKSATIRVDGINIALESKIVESEVTLRAAMDASDDQAGPA